MEVMLQRLANPGHANGTAGTSAVSTGPGAETLRNVQEGALVEGLKITNGLDSMCTVSLLTASQELMTAA